MLKFNSFIVVLLASFCFVSPSVFAESNRITLTKVVNGRTVYKVVEKQISASAIKLFCQNAENPKECDSNANAVLDAAKTAKNVVEVATVGTTAYAVTGASGPAIMHSLAVAGGPAVVGGLGGFAAADLMNDTLYSDCQNQNQQACDKAKYGTYTGAAVGAAASVGTLAVAGAGPAGLASIGAVVGGGMAAGATAVVAAPIVAAAAIGAAVYWLFSD